MAATGTAELKFRTRASQALQKHPVLWASLFVLIASIRIASTYRVFSFTIDEPCHFACGMEYLSKHVYRYETQHPPLARAMIALGPYLAGVRSLGGPERNTEGRALILHSRRPARTLSLMRLGVLPFFWIASLAVFLWSRHYFGAAVAVVAVAVFSLLPPILAHAGLATIDMAVTGCLASAFFATALWAESPGWSHGILLGLTVALAVLAKFTALLYLPSAIVVALVCYWIAVKPSLSQVATLLRVRAPSFAIAVLSFGFVIWAGYWFSYGKVNAWDLKLPAPEFFDGILAARAHNQNGHPAFLLGNFSTQGWWYYFPVALGVKTPIAFLGLAAMGAYTCVKDLSSSGCRLVLSYALGILGSAVLVGHIDLGVRQILPIYVGLAILAALGTEWLSRRGALGRVSAVVLLLWMVVSGGLQHPDYLSYFNAFAGPAPADVLVDSDLDWGQDTKRLARRLHELRLESVSLMLQEPLAQPLAVEEDLRRYYGLPQIHPVNFTSPADGWTVISPTAARTLGLPFKAWYERITPTEKVGQLWLYRINKH